MDNIILDKLTFKPNIVHLMKHLHIKEDTPDAVDFKRLAAEAENIARPKALYKVSLIESRGNDDIAINGRKFKSRVLKVNTEGINRLFPFLVTCGRELANWADSIMDILLNYYANELKLAALRSALRQLEKEIKRRFNPGRMARMQPGSLGDWPIQEQKQLFAILGDTENTIGVRLKSSMLMSPDKSESGVYLENEKGFASCQLCPVSDCPSRKAPYDKDLYEREYR